MSVKEVTMSNQKEAPKVSTKKAPVTKPAAVVKKKVEELSVNVSSQIKKHGLKKNVSKNTAYMIQELWKTYETQPMSGKTKVKILAEEAAIPKVIEK